jgi:hypothetical protein
MNLRMDSCATDTCDKGGVPVGDHIGTSRELVSSMAQRGKVGASLAASLELKSFPGLSLSLPTRSSPLNLHNEVFH